MVMNFRVAYSAGGGGDYRLLASEDSAACKLQTVRRSVHRWLLGEEGGRGDRLHMFRPSEMTVVTRS